MLFKDILLKYVDVDAQRNPIKTTAVESHRKSKYQELHHLFFFTYVLKFLSFVNLFSLILKMDKLEISRFKGYGK